MINYLFLNYVHVIIFFSKLKDEFQMDTKKTTILFETGPLAFILCGQEDSI